MKIKNKSNFSLYSKITFLWFIIYIMCVVQCIFNVDTKCVTFEQLTIYK